MTPLYKFMRTITYTHSLFWMTRKRQNASTIRHINEHMHAVLASVFFQADASIYVSDLNLTIIVGEGANYIM